jgi:hypothetical protein
VIVLGEDYPLPYLKAEVLRVAAELLVKKKWSGDRAWRITDAVL